MIPPRTLNRECLGSAVRIRITACRRRMRVNRPGSRLHRHHNTAAQCSEIESQVTSGRHNQGVTGGSQSEQEEAENT
jgi:hypothetical protein